METAIISPVEQKAITGLYTKASLSIVFIVCFVSTLFGGIVSMLMSVYLPVAVKDVLGNVSEDRLNNISAWINAVFIFGWMFGGFAWGFICDKLGRARSVILSTGFYGLFTLLTAFSPSWLLLSVCRFFSGFGIGGVLVTTTILVSELWDEKKRAVVLGIVSVAMPIGFFVAGAINNFIPDWHRAFLAGIIPLALSIVSVFILPESAKWSNQKAAATARENSSSQLFALQYKPNLIKGSLIFGSMLIGLWAIFSWAPTWVQSIANSAEVQQQRGATMMILAGGGLVGSFVSGWIVNAIGLRKTMMLCFAVCFIMTFIVFKLNTSVTLTTFIEMAILAFFFGISQGALSVYIPQLFPTAIRASATGFCFNIGRIFTGTVVFFIGALEGILGGYGNAVFIFSFIFLVGLVVTFFSKEKSIE